MDKIVYLNHTAEEMKEEATVSDSKKAGYSGALNVIGRVIPLGAALIPLVFALWIVFSKQRLEIWVFHETDYYVYNAVYLLVCFCWGFVAPWRKHFTGPVMSFVYNLAPVFAYLSLFYSQWHTLLVYCISASWALLVIFWWNRIDNASERDPNYRSKHQKSICFLWRRAIAALAAFLILPSILGAVKLSGQSEHVQFLRDYINPQTIACISNVNSKRELYEDAQTDLLALFSGESWRHLSPDEKLELLTRLAMFECSVLGISCDDLNGVRLSTDLPEGLTGYFDQNSRMIVLSAPVVCGTNRDKALQALLVGVFLYNEDEVIKSIDETIGWDSDFSQSQYFNQSRVWKENQDNRNYSIDDLYYDETAFWTQPYLKDALTYSEEELPKLLSFINEA